MTPARARAILALAERSADMANHDRNHAFAELLSAADEVVPALDVLSTTDPEVALRLAASLNAFWQDSGRVDEGRRSTEALLDLPRGEATGAFARALVVAAELAFRQGDQDGAKRHAASAIEAGRAADDAGAIGMAHVNLARVAYREGDAAGIENQARQALGAAPGDVATTRGAIHMLAWAAHTAGDRSTARRRFEESLALRREMGDRFGAAVEESNLADLAAEDGDVQGAAAGLGAALREADDLGSRYFVLNLLPSIAAIAARSGDDDDCARLLGATDAVSRASGLIPDPGNWQDVIDDARRRLGERFDVLWREGNALAEPAAVNLALAVTSRAAAAIASEQGVSDPRDPTLDSQLVWKGKDEQDGRNRG